MKTVRSVEVSKAMMYAATVGLLLMLHGVARALTPDQATLSALVANEVSWVASGSAVVTSMSISGNYALVAWSDSSNSGGELVASKVGGSWKAVKTAGGVFNASELTEFGADASTASFLVANLRPLPPAGGPSATANGASTHAVYTERCFTDTNPPRPYNW